MKTTDLRVVAIRKDGKDFINFHCKGSLENWAYHNQHKLPLFDYLLYNGPMLLDMLKPSTGAYSEFMQSIDVWSNHGKPKKKRHVKAGNRRAQNKVV